MMAIGTMVNRLVARLENRGAQRRWSAEIRGLQRVERSECSQPGSYNRPAALVRWALLSILHLLYAICEDTEYLPARIHIYRRY